MPEYDIPPRRPWYKRLWNWFLSLFIEEFEITVWYVYETIEDPRGMKTVKRKAKTYYKIKEIRKHSNTHIIARDQYNKKFEIKTHLPFDYEIRKIK